MTGDVVNLRQVRKAKRRLESAQLAEQARAAHGRSKAERMAAEAEADRLTRHLQQRRRERADTGLEQDQ